MSNTLKPTNSHEALALWLSQNQPQVFAALLAKANKQGQLHGITDWLSSVGTSLSSAVQSAGSFLASPAGVGTLAAIGTTYLQTQAQKDALKLQMAQAQAGYAMQPIVSNATSQQYPMYYNAQTGQYQPLTSSLTNQLMPQGMAQYAPYAIGLVAAGILFLVMKR